MIERTMPGLIPELYDPLIRWHAIQITVYNNTTQQGQQVKASVKAKLARGESWQDCAVDQMIALQGRGRDSRRAMWLLSETCEEYDLPEVRDHMLKTHTSLRGRVIELAQHGNPGWQEKFLRTGFGREKSRYTPGQRTIRPLNPGVQAVWDAGSRTFGLAVGGFTRVDVLTNSVSAAQRAVGIVAYGLWLVEAPEYAQDPLQETPRQRLARFRARSG